jgi:hypothetical protein
LESKEIMMTIFQHASQITSTEVGIWIDVSHLSEKTPRSICDNLESKANEVVDHNSQRKMIFRK